jgi:hypothetical protein
MMGIGRYDRLAPYVNIRRPVTTRVSARARRRADAASRTRQAAEYEAAIQRVRADIAAPGRAA